MGIQRQCFHHHTKLLSHDSLVHHSSARSWGFPGIHSHGRFWGRSFSWKITCFLWWEPLFRGRYLWGWCLPLITPGPRPRTFEAHERMRRVSAPHRWHLLINFFSLTYRPAWLRTPRCVLGRRMVRIKILHQYWYLVLALFSSFLYSRAQFSCFKGKGRWCCDYLHALVWAMSCS